MQVSVLVTLTCMCSFIKQLNVLAKLKMLITPFAFNVRFKRQFEPVYQIPADKHFLHLLYIT